MGRTRRKYQAELVRFQKTLRKPIRNVLSVMTKGFLFEDFLSEFKILYSYLWDDVCSKAKEYQRMDEGLKKKGFPKRYFFPSPDKYIKKVSTPIINNSALHDKLILHSEEREKFRNSLLRECAKKREKREAKLRANQKYIQEATPSYSNYYIQTYFLCKHADPTDVDTRYAILVEASKYKSPVTIKFLHKVNASERNYHLRYFAFLTLQKFNEKEVRLRKNRKKKRAGDTEVPKPINTPDDLIRSIYNSQLERMKEYDLFLSHSSIDSELLLKLKSILNHSNINVYIDWVCDRNALKRELTNVNTANTIIERLKSSKALLYVHTKASQNSKWIPWELGFIHAMKGKICIYNPENIDKEPYMEIYPTVIVKGEKLFVETEEGQKPIKEWIVGSIPKSV
ncbi:TIR domain-containing protein [Porphyromonas somerae]|uniref:toll/interleukin-1 receptor domain-containing protein n=1 Tax=Porphyromonas somerae TaxID=322095 RepID=UPI00036CECC4|nr:toll/interleukin-1 receptor domain-containing protein [Porphyromonas somerae]